MKIHHLVILSLLFYCLVLPGQFSTLQTDSVPVFGVLAAQGEDQPPAQRTRVSEFDPSGWQQTSSVRMLGARYLEQYLRRRRVALEGRLQVSISGISCRVHESRGYGRASYRVTYDMQLVASLNGRSVWSGTVHHRELNLTGTAHISEGIRLLLVKKGVNSLVSALCRGAVRQ